MSRLGFAPHLSIRLVIPTIIAACSGGGTGVVDGNGSTSSSSTSSGGNPNVATPQAIVEASVEQSEAGDCPAVGETFTLGAFGDQFATPPVPSQPVPDGQALSAGASAVRCTVKLGVGGRFTVDGVVGGESGKPYGKLTVNGTFATAGLQPNVSVTLGASTPGPNDLAQGDCTVTYSPFGGVAQGRVWGDIKCPKATTATGKSCNVVAQFRLENCRQE